jgi:hypothetical protein
MSQTRWTKTEGTDVIGSEGDQLGTVHWVENGVMIIRRGWEGIPEFALPLSVFESAGDAQVALKLLVG